MEDSLVSEGSALMIIRFFFEDLLKLRYDVMSSLVFLVG